MSFEAGRRVADAVLYEGYLLYPYRASSEKNQLRWQFGVLAPQAWSEAGGCESGWCQTELLVEGDAGLVIEGRLRFLQPRPRRVEVQRGGTWERSASIELDGTLHTSFEEGIEREVSLRWSPAEGPAEQRFEFSEPELREALTGGAARSVREAVQLEGCVRLAVSGAAEGWLRLRIRVENLTPWARVDAPRSEALAGAMAGVHWLLRAEGGRFLSLTDPPPAAREESAHCENVRSWPVLLGGGEDGDLQRSGQVLAAPIILPDHPEVAPESDGDFFDATEIDEMLSLRVHTLTAAEQREARATDPRAAEIVARCADLPAEALERMHGALRTWRELGGESPPAPASPSPTPPSEWQQLFEGPHPEEDSLCVEGTTLRKGSRVRLRPKRRADAQDLFLEGQSARVEGVFRDVEGRAWLGVVPESDESEDLFRWHGRFFYFHPDEVEPMQEGEA